MHDGPGGECREILESLIPAMGPESVILLDEMVSPDMEAHWHQKRWCNAEKEQGRKGECLHSSTKLSPGETKSGSFCSSQGRFDAI